MRCERNRPLLTRYAIGDLDESLSRELEQHLEKCSECRAELEAEREAVNLLKDVLARSAAPEALAPERKNAIMRSLERRERTPLGSARWIFGSHPVLARAAAVVVLAALAVGAVIFSLPSSRRLAGPAADESGKGVISAVPAVEKEQAALDRAKQDGSPPLNDKSGRAAPPAPGAIAGWADSETASNLRKNGRAAALGQQERQSLEEEYEGKETPAPVAASLARDAEAGGHVFDRKTAREAASQDALKHEVQESPTTELKAVIVGEREKQAGDACEDLGKEPALVSAAETYRVAAQRAAPAPAKPSPASDAAMRGVLANMRRMGADRRSAGVKASEEQLPSGAAEWQRRMYRIGSERLRAAHEARFASPAATDAESLRKYLEERGVSWPAGSFIAWDAEKGLLVVSNIVSNLDRIESIAAGLARSATGAGQADADTETPAASAAFEPADGAR